MVLSILKTLFFVLLILILPGSATAKEGVKVAVVGPMNGSSSSMGLEYKAGVLAALSTLPQGKLLGRPVTTTLYDDSCTPSIAEALAKEIIQNPPAVVIGNSCSGATIASAPYYANHKILQIVPASTNPKVTEMGIKTIFRMIGRDDIQGELAADHIAKLHKNKKLGILHSSSAYAKALSKTATDELAKFGITPKVVIEFKKGSTTYLDKIEELINNKIETLYIIAGGLDAGVFLRQSKQMGASFSLIGSDTLVLEVFHKTAGDHTNNVLFTFPPQTMELASAKEAIKAIKKIGYEPEGYTLLAYAAIEVWIEGVKRAQSFEADKVAAAIRHSKIDSLLGKISFDEKGDIITPFPPFVWYLWRDGQRVLYNQ